MLQELLRHRHAITVMAALVVGLYVWRRLRRWLRHRRPANLNPNLARYGGPASAVLAAEQRREADKIVATSSTGTIAGYELLRQIEAVCVDGFRHPEDALLGLKAAAAMKGANAVMQVQHSRSATGRCAASGDAVVVRRIESLEPAEAEPENEYTDPPAD